MKKYLLLLFFAGVFWGCNNPRETAENEEAPEELPVGQSPSAMDTTPRITGIGGVFFYSEDPAKTRQWYTDNLGLVTDEFGAVFEFRNASRPGEINYLRWSPFDKRNDYLAPSEKEFMINYRVQNLEGLVRQLKANGVNVLGEIETYPYGKFAWVMDPDGLKIELWEPVDSVLTQMGGKTNK